ncbi:MAG TPA: hypothetical protein VER33_12745 [Polyangiaceae bacterium]|nr:hypothetical protein [Polyangiaceae bacterium]
MQRAEQLLNALGCAKLNLRIQRRASHRAVLALGQVDAALGGTTSGLATRPLRQRAAARFNL